MKLLDIPTKLLFPLRAPGKHTSLCFSPDELDIVSVFIIICCFIARSVKHAVGFGTPFAILKNNAEGPSSDQTIQMQTFAVPDLSLSMPLLLKRATSNVFLCAIEPQLNTHVDFKLNNLQLCLYLAAVSEPAMLLLLAKQSCPIRPLGAVNVRNRFELLQPGICRALFGKTYDVHNLKVDMHKDKSTGLALLARFSGPALRVRRGVEIDIEVTIVLEEADNINSRTGSQPEYSAQHGPIAIFRQQFTMLQFMKFKDKPLRGPPEQVNQADLSSGPIKNGETVSPTINMTTDAPGAWAKLCKDYNPIHFSPTIAKILGQTGQLAHGNHAVGICVQSLSRFIDKATYVSTKSADVPNDLDTIANLILPKVDNSVKETDEWCMEVKFRRPIVLPASIGLRLHDTGHGFDIINKRNGKVSIEVLFH